MEPKLRSGEVSERDERSGVESLIDRCFLLSIQVEEERNSAKSSSSSSASMSTTHISSSLAVEFFTFMIFDFTGATSK